VRDALKQVLSAGEGLETPGKQKTRRLFASLFQGRFYDTTPARNPLFERRLLRFE